MFKIELIILFNTFEIKFRAAARKLGNFLKSLALNKYFQWIVNIPLMTKLFEKFSQQEMGLDLELNQIFGTLTVH